MLIFSCAERLVASIVVISLFTTACTAFSLFSASRPFAISVGAATPPLEATDDVVTIYIDPSARNDEAVALARTLQFQLLRPPDRRPRWHLRSAREGGNSRVDILIPRQNEGSLPDARATTVQSGADVQTIAADYGGAALLIIWGEVFQLGNIIAMHAQLSIPQLDNRRAQALQTWTVDLGSRDLRFSADWPARRWDFGPVPLDRRLVEHYAANVEWPMLRYPYTEQVSQLRPDDNILIVPDEIWWIENWVFVAKAEDQSGGWIEVPSVATIETGLVEVTQALMWGFKGEWGTAADILDALPRRELRAENDVKARLAGGFAKQKAGRSGRRDFQAAWESDPYSETAATMLMMSYLSELDRLRGNQFAQKRREEIVHQMETLIEDTKWLFAPTSPFRRRVMENIEQLREIARGGPQRSSPAEPAVFDSPGL